MSEQESVAEEPGLTVIEPAPADGAGMLSIHYRDGQPVIIVSGGDAIPATITVTDTSGTPVAAYTAGPAPTTKIVGGAPATPHEFPWMIDLRNPSS
ncbi:hypothetical protein [Actinokineospora sp. HUAS TT18]|uniref:hypothetical protein n=1 Tax=Actinokineospora sp. HUAS TT18 TaxID=3447451 RepID=UPI003F51CFB0